MRIGPLEIVLIIVVVIAAALIARLSRPGRVPAPRDPGDKPGATSPGARGIIKKTGIIIIIGGLIILAAAAGLFRWALQGYLWALVLIAGGTIMILLGRRKA
jgi:hypothetical protein